MTRLISYVNRQFVLNLNLGIQTSNRLALAIPTVSKFQIVQILAIFSVISIHYFERWEFSTPFFCMVWHGQLRDPPNAGQSRLD